MNERIKKLSEQADAYADAMDGSGKNYIGLRDNYFAELIVQECINCYSPDDSATDWADKMRRMIEP